jgi:hypothetical protein
MTMDHKQHIHSTTVTSDVDITSGADQSKSIGANQTPLDPRDYSVRSLQDIHEKKHWLQLFRQEYEGKLVSIKPSFFAPTHKYLVLSVQGIDVGFAMISQINQQMQAYFGWSNAWKADLTLVKEAHRSRGYQRLLLAHAIAEHGCKAINLLYQRYLDNQDYFASLGFSHAISVDSTSVLVMIDELLYKAIETRPQDFQKVVASTEDELLEAMADLTKKRRDAPAN